MNDMTRRKFLMTAGAGVAVAAVTGTGLRSAFAADKIKITASDALLVIDVQNCFIPGGSLAVKEGDAIVPLINTIARSFQNVVLTQDWHTADHVSFASQHDGKKPFETIKLSYGTQVL
jgi:nicotinamidase/pyrazinamidase